MGPPDGIYHDRTTRWALPEDAFRFEQIAVPALSVPARDESVPR